MIKFDIITIFPNIFESYFTESIIKRAQKADLVQIRVHDLRDYTSDKHNKVDDTPYGGGAGMVMRIEPIWRCVQSLKLKGKAQNAKLKNSPAKTGSRTILFSAKGKKYTQADAKRLAKYDKLILICGRYEGVDERVAEQVVDEEISIGNYVLTGGEIPAMVLVDSITRLLPGVLGNPKSLEEESFSSMQDENIVEYPQYTKPEDFMGHKVPEILLSGNHKEIRKWREKNSKKRT